MDSTAIKAYSQRDLENRRGKSDLDARVGRGRRGFVLGYKVHTVCCTSSELPLAFTVEPCNVNEKHLVKPLLEKLHVQRHQLQDCYGRCSVRLSKGQGNNKEYGAEPVIPYRKCSKIKNALRVGRDFVVHGVKRALLETVTEPDMKSPREVRFFL